MKVEKAVCPYCGAPLAIDPSFRQAKCEYCGMTSLLRTEVQKAETVDPEEQGYRFEKGRQRAQAEAPVVRHVQRTVVHVAPEQPKKKKKHVFWWIVGFLFIYPLPASILLSKNQKMNGFVKGLLYFLFWGSYLFLMFAARNQS